MRVEADRKVCEGHGFCEELAPTVFELDEDGKVTVIEPVLAPSHELDAEAAAATCPVRAIRLSTD